MSGIRFSLNRTCSPTMTLAQFLVLAVAAGVEAIEVRNDIPGREFSDGTEADELRAVLAEAGLRLASINALQRFNNWDRNRADEALSLVRFASAIGAPGIVLCPVVDVAHGWSESQLEEKLRQSLRKLRPISRSRRYRLCRAAGNAMKHNEAAEDRRRRSKRCRGMGRLPNLPRYVSVLSLQ